MNGRAWRFSQLPKVAGLSARDGGGLARRSLGN
jgi:hypothetical protein